MESLGARVQRLSEESDTPEETTLRGRKRAYRERGMEQAVEFKFEIRTRVELNGRELNQPATPNSRTPLGAPAITYLSLEPRIQNPSPLCSSVSLFPPSRASSSHLRFAADLPSVDRV
jgi:hypothetical protein